MVYTVNELARLAGVSKRTLHYYDEIGLLKPSFLKENGYRFYAEKELLMARGALKKNISRKAAYTPDPSTVEHISELNRRILKALEGVRKNSRKIHRMEKIAHNGH